MPFLLLFAWHKKKSIFMVDIPPSIVIICLIYYFYWEGFKNLLKNVKQTNCAYKKMGKSPNKELY